MNALVVNCSSRYNLGAERLAVWLRGRGASVQAFHRNGLPGDLDLAWADEVYLSAVFSWDLPVAASIARRAMSMDWVEAEGIHIGGPAVEYNAAWVRENAGVEPWRGVHPCAEVEVENPRMTWTSRGCVNRCPFCIVWRLQDGLVELENWQLAPVVMDDNFLATSSEHQARVVARFAAAGIREIDFNQGLDAHLYTPDFRHLLERHKVRLKTWRFAYDSDGDWPAVQCAIEDVRQAGGVGWRDISVYVLYNYRETPEEAIERCERVIGGNHSDPFACPWPMAYKPLDWLSEDEEYVASASGWTVQQVRDVRRYYGRPAIWRSAAWKSYNRSRRTRRIEAKGYPADWGEVAGRVKTLARWRCEHCGRSHNPDDGYTLTVHHIDGNPAHNADDNLVALCQRCHLSWQQRWSPAQAMMDFARPGWMVRRGLGAVPLPSTGKSKKDAGDKQ